MAHVVTVNVGGVADLPYRGRMLASGIVKLPVDGPVAVRVDGIDGDAQGDTRSHGGPEKVLCVYASEHYAYWSERLGGVLPEHAAFGENLTTAGLVEDEVCIGDVLAIGTVTAQVSLPRAPCYRLAARHGCPELARWVQESGWTGYYLRVLEPGTLAAGDAIELVDRPQPHATVAEVNRVVYRDRRDLDAIRRLIVPELTERWRAKLQRRLDGSLESQAARLYGPG